MPYIQKSKPFKELKYGPSVTIEKDFTSSMLMEQGPFGNRKKKKKSMVPGQNRARLTAKQKRNRQFFAPIAGAGLGTLATDKGIRQKFGKGIKRIFKMIF